MPAPERQTLGDHRFQLFPILLTDLRWVFQDFHFYVDDELVGSFQLQRQNGRETCNRVVTHSHLEDRYRGKGYGRQMYYMGILWGLQRGLEIWSTGVPSTDAVRTWESEWLNKKLLIRRERLHTFGITRFHVIEEQKDQS